MADQELEPRPEEPEVPKFRGLYRHVKISVKTLDKIIILCIAVIIIVVAIDLLSPGFTVTFDSQGGTDVPSQTRQYGEKLELPEPPTREGYRFTGWCIDPAGQVPWNMDTDTVEQEMTLYAAWEPVQ